MNGLKKDIDKYINDLKEKVDCYETESKKQIEELEIKVSGLESKLDTATKEKSKEQKELENKKKELTNQLSAVKEQLKEITGEKETLTANFKGFTDKIKNFIHSDKKYKENLNIINQQVNIGNLEYIEELSLIKLKVDVKEFIERDLGKNIQYRALYDVKFTIKLAVDLKQLKYTLEENKNKRILNVYNVPNKIKNFAEAPDPIKIFSEKREKKSKLFSKKTLYDVNADPDDCREEDEKSRKDIMESINKHKYLENIEFLNETFDKAIERYLKGIVGDKMEIKIHHDSNAEAGELGETLNEYNSKLGAKNDVAPANFPEKDLKVIDGILESNQ